MRRRIPTVNSCCGCLSLTTGLKVFGSFTLLDCASTIVSNLVTVNNSLDHCLFNSVACQAMCYDIVIKVIHTIFTCLMLKAVCKTSWRRLFCVNFREGATPSPLRWILWWIVSNLIVAVLDVTVLVPALSKYSGIPQWCYLFYRVLDLYACLLAFSYYKRVNKSKSEDCYVVITSPTVPAHQRTVLTGDSFLTRKHV